MKREGYQHPKIYSLAGRLGICRAQAIGHLDLLWDFTAMSAIAGDVGKWDNCAIARACDWGGDADQFVDALLGAGLVDCCQKNRLLVHDWADHCEQWVKLRAARLGIEFIAEPSADLLPKAFAEASVEAPSTAVAEASPREGEVRIGEEGSRNGSGVKAKKFVPPTLEEVEAYCDERENDILPEAFIAHYEANGWRVGRAPGMPMKNWKQAIITWENSDIPGGRRKPTPGSRIVTAKDMEREPYNPHETFFEGGRR